MAKDKVKRSVNNAYKANTKALNIGEGNKAALVKARALRSRRTTRFIFSARGMSIIASGFFGFLALVMIASFMMSKFLDLDWHQTFWKSYPGVNYRGESTTFWYFDVFSYLKGLGNTTDWARYFWSSTLNAFSTVGPEHWSVLNALIFQLNLIIMVLNLVQVPVKLGAVILMYAFSIFGFTRSFPLYGFNEWILTNCTIPYIPYLYQSS